MSVRMRLKAVHGVSMFSAIEKQNPKKMVNIPSQTFKLLFSIVSSEQPTLIHSGRCIFMENL